MATHNPATSIGGHVAVDLQPLAEIPIDGDGVDATQRVPVHQVLGAVLRVSKDTSTWEIKKKIRNVKADFCVSWAPLVTAQETPDLVSVT